MKNVIVAILILVTGQLGLFAQDKIIELSGSSTGNKSFVARDAVVLKPGFAYTASSAGDMFTAAIDERMVCNAEYLSSPINLNNRQLNFSAPVGATQGAAAVSPTGAATYQIPLHIPAGIAGMQPDISIVYNSQAGSGLLGVGWDIAGLSAITRVPRTIYHDNASDGIGYNLGDRYSLDGNRLVAVSGNYGQENTVYETEIKTFAKIESFGMIEDSYLFGLNKVKTGPSWFRVTTKDGKIIEYGNTPDSRVIPGTKSARLVWRVNKITDPNGNFITFTYRIINDESVIERIDYTGNGSNGGKNSIQFFYDKKADAKRLYVAGRGMDNALILRKIKVLTEGVVVRTYDFDYIADNGKSYLNQITETGNDGQQLNATVIAWGSDNKNIVSSVVTGPAITKDHYLISDDLNGDGISDVICLKFRSSKSITVPYLEGYSAFTLTADGLNVIDVDTYLGRIQNGIVSYNYDATFYNIPSNSVVTDFWNSPVYKSFGGASLSGDFNGDGRRELVIPLVINAQANRFYFFVKGSFDFYFGNIINFPIMPIYTVGDFNNDGKDEIVYFEVKKNLLDSSLIDFYIDSYIKPILNNIGITSNDDSFFANKIFFINKDNSHYKYIDIDTNLSYEPKNIFNADYNNDGLLDLLLVCDAGYIFYINKGGSLDSDGYRTVSFARTELKNDFNGDYSVIRQGDFNGDGLMDLILNEHCNSKWKLAISNGNFGFTFYDLPNITAVEDPFTKKNDDKDNCIITDFNHDGKSDVIIIDAVYHDGSKWFEESYGVYDYTNIYWYRSNGTGFDCVKSLRINDEHYTFNRLICQGDFNGDGYEDILNFGADLYGSEVKDENFRLYSAFNHNFEGGLVKTISDGFNNQTTFTYQPLSYNKTQDGRDFYTKGTSSTYPVIDLQAPMYCVASMTVPDGIGGTITTKYAYENARVHLTGKGFLGFSKIVATTDPLNKKIITTNQLDNNSYLLTKQTVEVKTLSDALLAKTENNFANTKSGNSYFSYLSSSVSTDYLTNTSTATSYIYSEDGYGNLISETVNSYGNSYIQTTNYSSYVNAGSWIPNKPEQVTITRKHPDDGSNFSNTTKYTYDAATGNITSEIKNYNVAGKQVTITYSNFDSWGHPCSVVTSATSEGGNVSLKKTFSYDASGRFITSVTDALGTTSYTYDGIYGSLIKSKGIDGLVTEYKYDCWGLVTETLYPDGNKSTVSYQWAKGSGPANALYYVQSNFTGKPWTRTWYDALGRVLREETVGYNGISIYSDIVYNNKGQVVRKSSYSGGTKISEVTYTYFDDGRLKSETYSTGKTVSYAYSGQTVSITTNNRTTQYTYGNWGEVKRIVEPSPGSTITYTYYSNGKPKNIQSGTTTITMTYDALGYQTSLTDPDAGTYQYRYDALGRLTYQKDSRNNETRLYYDNVGRIDYKTINSSTYDYEYYTTGVAKGSLQRISAPNGTWESYEYDNLGRLSKTTQHIDASINDLEFQYAYDGSGNMNKIVYPGGLTVNREYDSYGNLTKAVQGNTVIWQLNSLNATRMAYTLGNGLVTEKTFDNNGYLASIKTQKGTSVVQWNNYSFDAAKALLLSREDARTGYGLKETFSYDGLDRLTEWKIYKNSALQAAYGMSYGGGKILGKSDVGNYFYNSSSTHRLDSVITSGIIGLTTPAEQSVSYNSINKVSNITEGNNVLNITYGPDNERVKTEFSQGGTLKTTRYYGGLYEAKKDAGQSLTSYCYIEGGDGIAAVVVSSNGNSTTYYVHKDHLGSIICLTDAAGKIKEEMSYDPWGRRRNPTDWSFNNVAQPIILSRGFTGHEHIDAFQLINMNGRMYDPVLGMFLSPDNYVQAPGFSQNFNRYAYCVNNPLGYVDPGGEVFVIDDILIAAAIGAIINVGIQGVSGNINSARDFFLAAGVGALAGAGGAFVGQAVAGAITFGGFAGGATIGAASGAASGFIAGAGNAWANGAKFGDGLKAGLIGGGIGALTGGLVGGFARGISDYRNGYSFWDGSKVDEFVVGSAQYDEIASRYNTSAQADINDEILQMRMQDEFGISEGDLNIKDITTRTDKGYGMTSSGKYVNLKSRDMVGGYVRHFSSGYSDVHVSPYYSNGDAIDFRAVAGHELIHAYHYYALPNVSTVYTERVAYKYTYDVYMNNGRFTSALSTMKTAMFNSSGSFWGPYPAQYQIPSPYRFY